MNVPTLNRLRKAAEAGDAHAMVNLGSALHNGCGVQRDPRAAVSWWRRAVAAGERREAAYNLAMCAFEGHGGLRRSARNAERWFRMAARAGDPDALYVVGDLLGEGPAPDRRTAILWCWRGAVAGDVDDMVSLGVAFHEGAGVRRNDREAVRWYRQAMAGGERDHAPHNLGICYKNGTGVRRSRRLRSAT